MVRVVIASFLLDLHAVGSSKLHSVAWCHENFYDSKLSHIAPRTLHERPLHVPTKFAIEFEIYFSTNLFV